MDNKELEKKDRSTLGFDKGKNRDDYKFLVQKLKSIKDSIHLLEKNLLQKEM